MTTQKQDNRASSPTVNLLRASSRGQLHRVIRAINEGAELAVNKNGGTALHIASHKGFLDIVRILLSAGCELDIQDDKGDTALHRACIAGHDHVVKRLLEEGVCVDRQNQMGDSALHEAANRGYSRCVAVLIKARANIGSRNKNQDTPIHLACANSHAGSLRLLLSSYPHASPKNVQGDTPLHIAVRFGHVTCARVLISAQCTIDHQNKQGNSPLHIATIARHRKLVRVLLDADAQAKTVRNIDGKSALDIAKDNDDGETAVMLISGSRHHTMKDRFRGRSRSRNGERIRSHSEPRRQESHSGKNDERKMQGCNASNISERVLKVKERPKSATLPRKSYVQARAKWRRHERLKSENATSKTDILGSHQRQVTVNPYIVPQLYSLYRDDNGNVRQKAVVDQLPNPTPELVNSITEAVENSKGELLHEIKKTNQLLETRMDQLENNTEFKVAKLDQITKERINAERMQCLHRIDRRATLERVVCACRRKEMCEACRDSKLQQQDCLEQKSTAHHEKNFDGSKSLDLSDDYSLRKTIYGHSMGRSKQSFKNEQNCKVNCDGAIGMLRPYHTVKIDRENTAAGSFTPTFNTLKHKSNISQHVFAEGLNRSDSAYGSLSPQVIVRPAVMTKQTLHQRKFKKNGDNRGFETEPCVSDETCFSSNSIPAQRIEENINFQNWSEGEADVTRRITQQFFENVTCAMEDWYERRLREATEKQQREMNLRMAQLEDRMKYLQTHTKGDLS